MQSRAMGIISFLIIMLVLLSACGRGYEPYANEDPPVYENHTGAEVHDYHTEAEKIIIPQPTPIPGPLPLTDVFRSGLTRAQYLEDLNYLYEVFKYNFALFQPLYRRHGVDLHELFQNAIHRVETADINDLRPRNAFIGHHGVLRTEIFNYINGFGHVALLDDGDVRFRLALFSSEDENNPFAPFVDVIDNPATRRFYNLTDADFESGGAHQSRFLQPRAGNVETRIVEEGRIAHVRIRQMCGSSMEQDYPLLIEFFESVADYEHLIIDIRGNGGGHSLYFPNLVIAPNINETLHYNFYWFLMAGEHNMRFLRPFIERGYMQPFSPTHPALFDSLPYFHPHDRENLDYYMRISGEIHPSRDQAIFGSKIWMLINRANFSASEYAAFVVRETNFATLVGEPTGGGGIGTNPTILALPNTGIIIQYQTIYGTCFEGRNSYEYGTVPHVLNFEGHDALRTVLALIEEGDWQTN